MNDIGPMVVGSFPKQEIESYLNRVLRSQVFRKSHVLQQLLSYLVRKAAEGQSHEIKEHVIGMDVFGRPQDFDSRIDNIVRVQAHRLRKLLGCYYAEEGKDDCLQFSIPKGSYVPKMERSAPAVEVLSEEGDPYSPEAPVPVYSEGVASLSDPCPLKESGGRRKFSLVGTFAAGAVCVLLANHVLSDKTLSVHAQRPSRMLTHSVLALWKPILQGQAPTILSFVNPVFLRHQDPGSGLFRYNGHIDVPLGTRVDFTQNLGPKPANSPSQEPMFLYDTWTGTGEALSISKLSSLFTEAGCTLSVKRSRTLSIQDLRGANVIFIGNSESDPILKNVTSIRTPYSCCAGTAILNHEARAGDPVKYGLVRDQSSNQLVASHALFSVLPGLDPRTKIFVAAGLSTHGTWAAVDYLTSEVGAAALIQSLGARGTSLPEFFQAIIRTDIVKGDAVNCSLIAARRVCTSASADCPSPNPPVSGRLIQETRAN